MEIYVATEQHFFQYQGIVYTEAVGGNDFWQRYLDVFTAVNIIARVRKVDVLPETAVSVTGNGVKVIPLPDYLGPLAGIAKLPQIWQRLGQVSKSNGAFLLRVPGAISSILYWHLRLKRHPYAIEVVGDPYDSLSSQALGKSLATYARPIAVYTLRQQSKNANCATFVTRKAIQSRYPTKAEFATFFSDIYLPQSYFSLAKRCKIEQQHQKHINSPSNLIFIGSLSQRYKGLHVLLSALRTCLDTGIKLHLSILGDGMYRSEYETLAKKLNLDANITFHGYIKQGEAVIKKLSAADLFVMPSLVEGLPRAMIEAMACGLPCIGSNIGGIPELLESAELVPPGDSQALANKIMTLLQNPQQMKQIGKQNLEVAKEYRSDILHTRRKEFYKQLHHITAKHIQLRSH